MSKETVVISKTSVIAYRVVMESSFGASTSELHLTLNKMGDDCYTVTVSNRDIMSALELACISKELFANDDFKIDMLYFRVAIPSTDRCNDFCLRRSEQNNVEDYYATLLRNIPVSVANS